MRQDYFKVMRILKLLKQKMKKHRKSPIIFLANGKIADFAIYTGMATYILLFIFRDYETYILWVDIVLEIIKIPYFKKINEQAVVNESFFYIAANLVAVVIGTDAVNSHILECVNGLRL